MAIGIKVIVLLNLATEANIANGIQGEIQNIILDKREEVSEADEDGTISLRLKYPPAMILFKPDGGTKLIFQALPPGLIPLTPSLAKFSIITRSRKKKQDCKTPICHDSRVCFHQLQIPRPNY